MRRGQRKGQRSGAWDAVVSLQGPLSLSHPLVLRQQWVLRACPVNTCRAQLLLIQSPWAESTIRTQVWEEMDLQDPPHTHTHRSPTEWSK